MRDLARLALLIEHNALDRAKSCTAKVAHYSLNDAKHACKVAAMYKRVFETYKCVFSPKDRPHWHVTSCKFGEEAA